MSNGIETLEGRDGACRGVDANVLNLPSEKYPRRASDGGTAIGFHRVLAGERDAEMGCSAGPSTSTIKAYQECQDLQVRFFSFSLYTSRGWPITIAK